MAMAPDQLGELEPEHSFFVGIDSDGCVFDSMEIKHKECFCPAFIDNFDLQAVAKYAREVWEFVNLYSKTRGINRFKAVLRALELVAARPETSARGVSVQQLPGLRAWVERETKLGNPALDSAVEESGDEDLTRTQTWSRAVNAAVEKIVRGVPAFPKVHESLEKLAGRADAVCVSQTPTEALSREWAEHDLDGLVRFIAGQELGTKAEHLTMAAREKYESSHILMIGDAPGDLSAARAVDALFYPILPGREEESWARFFDEALDRFFNEGYAGDYEASLLKDFEAALPETPPWEDV
jgi:phosphoglycolate phosphatase-like HAD superfamily hydrolase